MSTLRMPEKLPMLSTVICVKDGAVGAPRLHSGAGRRGWWPRPEKTAGFLLHMQRVKLSLRIQGTDSPATQHTQENEAPEVSL